METLYGHAKAKGNDRETGIKESGPSLYHSQIYEGISYRIFTDSAELLGDAKLYEQ